MYLGRLWFMITLLTKEIEITFVYKAHEDLYSNRRNIEVVKIWPKAQLLQVFKMWSLKFSLESRYSDSL